ncbi:glycosyltransferase [Rhodopirellula sp. JC740]|uniref:Glycosyltransferase n=1 Tax=Rhodopirellula halodulae TaxID=2894198 RepID=A0ABS8NEL8_9BACT|nr:glycosyltransferase family 2 protein [Rhodopirellula sp. JC740]MCC9641978.1 glycosyltransferase [Rhodopirellula sp. JC740]
MKLSVLTIVRGRQSHLENQMRGLLQSELAPIEWVVVGMNQDVSLPSTDQLTIRTSSVHHPTEALPLAAARNHAASLCRTDAMVFLDVDCIPSPSMLDRFAQALTKEDRLWMGHPMYLPAGATQSGKPTLDGTTNASAWSMTELAEQAVDHPLQPSLPQNAWIASDRYELFWSLCFAITRNSFDQIGGFDESFDGYGGEDTDFSFSARRAGVPFGFVDAVAYHQHHAVCKPPLNHLQPIVQNAEQFRKKWGCWPMEAWLKAFAAEDFIEFDQASDHIQINRLPTDTEIRACQTMTPAGF